MRSGDATETAASEEAFEEKTSCCASGDTSTMGVHAANPDIGTSSVASGVADGCSTLKNLQRCCSKIDSRVAVSAVSWVGGETIDGT